jgi:hypothetical protein
MSLNKIWDSPQSEQVYRPPISLFCDDIKAENTMSSQGFYYTPGTNLDTVTGEIQVTKNAPAAILAFTGYTATAGNTNAGGLSWVNSYITPFAILRVTQQFCNNNNISVVLNRYQTGSGSVAMFFTNVSATNASNNTIRVLAEIVGYDTPA